MNHIKSTEQVSCAEKHNLANFGFLWLKIPLCWFMNAFQSFDSLNFFSLDNRLCNVYGHRQSNIATVLSTKAGER